ncbi:MAG: trwJ [Nevskia sp.]|nr:trwJ [Nevskia sp.]
MKIPKVVRGVIAGAALLAAADASATGYPVIDISNLMQAMQEYEQLTHQLAQMQQQYASLTGGRGMGNLYNSPLEQGMRQFAPGSWQQSLGVLQQGGLPGSAADVSRAAQTFATSQGINQTGSQVFPGRSGNNADAVAYTNSSGATAAAAGLSQAAFDQTQARMQRIQQYLAQINSTSDIKASIDLNARLLAELNEAITQLIQLQAAQMQVAGSASAAHLRGNVEETAFVPYNGVRP